MTHCTRCHRPLKNPSLNGMGPKCAKLAAPPPPIPGRDLFGFDVDAACIAVRAQLAVFIEGLALDAHAAVRAAFRQARVRHGVWAK